MCFNETANPFSEFKSDKTMNRPHGTVKITFSGDIMCDYLEVPAYKTETGDYDFNEMFKDCKSYFSLSDYVVGNLETPIANAKYSDKPYDFNSPLEFAEAIRDNGFSMVTTANNHCLDRDISGLEDTIMALDTIGIKHTGTNIKDLIPSGIVETIGNMKIGFLSYTYGTNAFFNSHYLGKAEKWKVNLYQEQELNNPIYRSLYNSSFCSYARRTVNFVSRCILHKNIFCDVYERNEKKNSFLKRMKKDIQALKDTGGAEYVVMCLHSGGQYNLKPLTKTKKIALQIASMGVDAIIINHEHIVHHGEVISDKIVVYSLGDFTSTAGVHCKPYDKMANYSVVFNLYLAKENEIVKPVDVTFSILKTIPAGENRVKTVFLFDLIRNCTDIDEQNELLQDNLKVHNLFRNIKETEIELKLEYRL